MQALGAHHDARQSPADGGASPSVWHIPGQQQQQQVQAVSDSENAALQQMLLSMSADVTRVERSMREIATLNQMFSTAIAHQSEQIEQIYSQVRVHQHNSMLMQRRACHPGSCTSSVQSMQAPRTQICIKVASPARLLGSWCMMEAEAGDV